MPDRIPPERRELHALEVKLARGGSAVLLALASTLHRRGVEVTEATFGFGASHDRRFAVRFWATRRQTATITASIRNLIDVLDVQLDRSDEPTCASRPRVLAKLSRS